MYYKKFNEVVWKGKKLGWVWFLCLWRCGFFLGDLYRNQTEEVLYRYKLNGEFEIGAKIFILTWHWCVIHRESCIYVVSCSLLRILLPESQVDLINTAMFSTAILLTLLSFATAPRRGNVTAQDADRCGSRCNDHWDCGTSSPCTVCYDNCVDPAVCVNTTEAVPIQCVKPTEAAIIQV